MRRFFSPCFLLTWTALAAGCARYAPADTAPVPSAGTAEPPSSLPVRDLPHARRVAARAVVHCEDATQCSPSVAMLISVESHQVYQCTAFLVAPDILATNSHCIPSDLKAPGSVCTDRLAALFPAFGDYPETRGGCASVIQASPIDDKRSAPDFAFVRLDAPINRPALAINRQGMPDGATYALDKVDPYVGRGYPEGYLRRTQCRAVLGSRIVANSGDAQSPLVTVADCQVNHGNSGSPLRDAQGEAVGIVFATVPVDDLNQDLNRADKGVPPRALLEDTRLPPFAVATNFACAGFPADVLGIGAPSPACQAPMPSPDEAYRRRILADQQGRLAESRVPLDPAFRWKIALVSDAEVVSPAHPEQADPSQSVGIAIPDCVLDPRAFLASAPVAALAAASATAPPAHTRLPAWVVRMKLNHYLQADQRVREAPPAFEDDLMLIFNAQPVAQGQRSRLLLVDTAHFRASKPIYDGYLAVCPGVTMQ